MAKETSYWFSHDYNARTSPKIKRLLARLGMGGYGVFWSLVEDLYNNANALPLDCETITYDLRADAGVINSVIHDFGLFEIDEESGTFSSESVGERMAVRLEKSAKARESAEKRWKGNANAPKPDANTLQSESDGNANKDIKGKDNKEKKVKEKKTKEKPLPDAGATGGLEKSKEVFNGAKERFLTFYCEKFKEEYYFTGTDASKIKSLLKKIAFKMREKSGAEPTDLDLVNSTEYFFQKAHATANDWLLSNFTLSILESKFNEIFLAITGNGANTNNGTGNRANGRSGGNKPTAQQRANSIYDGTNN